MATFGKGQSYKGQRVHVTSVFDQKSGKGKNVSFSISNDTREGEDVFTDPMLSYDTYEKDGVTKNKFAVGYSNNQWEAIENAANKEGDKMVVIADLFPRKNGPGMMVNTNKLETPDVPFDADKHTANTLAAREAKKAAREAKANEGTEQEAAVEQEMEA